MHRAPAASQRGFLLGHLGAELPPEIGPEGMLILDRMDLPSEGDPGAIQFSWSLELEKTAAQTDT